MPDKYSTASEPATIGRKLIKAHHDHLAMLRVEFVFFERLDKEGTSHAPQRKGRNLYGLAKLVGGLNAYLSADDTSEPTPFFVILISKFFWTTASQEFKHALIDHELSHCDYDAQTDRFSMIDHDLAEFVSIVKRHGLWNHDVEVFVHAAKQEKFDFAADPKPPANGKTKPRAGELSEASR